MKTALWELGKVPVVIRDLWKGLTMAILGVTLLASSFTVSFHTFLPPWTYSDGYYIMKPKEQRSLSIGWGLGSFVRGMLATRGEDGHISIIIKDYDGNTIIDERTVSGRFLFEFQTEKIEPYILVLSNGHEGAQETVYLAVSIYYYSFLFLLIGVTLSIAGAYAMLRKERMMNRELAQTLEATITRDRFD
ncbi:MAG: hypothetical protein OEZ48_14500 [Candidatus Bathyarchaeota archaeon]|nr:hypothetical protein [Candidatus Bathyarchaeota archaeon]MDH5689054.1 hypothetical protein [Candidatus Bathyarchaeota archaeon]